MWLLVVIVIVAIIGMVLEGVIGILVTGAGLSLDLLLKFFKGSITDKLILTIIVIDIAFYIINAFIWDSEIFIILTKVCAVVVVALVVIKVIKLIFAK